jgi:uncharacterized membrane protein HdeD (DUF308 family)
MTSPTPDDLIHDFTLNASQLSKSAINGIRAAFGIGGIVAIILGIILLVWPGHTLVAVAVIFGIYFIVAGIVRLAIGIFSRGITGGLRTLNILFGVLLLIAGIIALKNVTIAAVALIILIVAIIGVGWIIEGVMTLAESGRAQSRGLAITGGIIGILAGIVVLAIPGWSALWLLVFTSIVLIVLGIFAVVRAFTFGREALKALG